MDPRLRTLLTTALLGLAAGWLASWIVGGSGLVTYLVSGLLGAIVGSALLKALDVDLGIGNPVLREVVVATLGAIVVVLLARLVA